MKSALRFWVFMGSVVLLATALTGQAAAASAKTHKVMIYPATGETLEQLQQQGVKVVHNYGTYWLVKATDAQWNQLKSTYGTRAVKANYLNVIELDAAALDTSAATPEPSLAGQLQPVAPQGKRLRLVQFGGPIVPEWLDQLKAAGNVKIVAYMPNSSYLVWLDGAAEKKIQGLLEPAGPVQWIGPYHPGYKLKGNLKTLATGPVTVRIGVVDSPDAAASIRAIQQLAIGQASQVQTVAHYQQIEVTIDAGQLAAIAQLPDVVWVEQVVGAHMKDEVQDLIVATFTNGPGHGPVSGIGQYMGFLTNQVGFSTDSGQYPIVDVADTGLDNGSLNPYHPTFYEYLNMYQVLPFIDINNPPCLFAPLMTRIRYNDGPDCRPPVGSGHGTLVASIITGADTLPSETVTYTTIGDRVETLVVLFQCFTSVVIQCSQDFPPTVCVTNTFINCGYVTNCLAECHFLEEIFPIPRRDQNGHQYGLGVNPFGRIGMSLIFGGASSGVVSNGTAIGEVMNAYLRQARIGNNSWGEALVTNVNDGVYSGLCATYDVLTRDAVTTGVPGTPGLSPLNQEFILVFAGGNANGVSEVGGFGDVLVTPPATSKNVISVGASENVRGAETFCEFPSDKDDSLDISYFNSFGPTRDGRFKPDLVAPGTSVTGADTQFYCPTNPVVRGCVLHPTLPATPPPVACNQPGDVCLPAVPVQPIEDLYVCGSGTSFSAPAVSGAMQLLWWYFQNRLHMLQPSPAMAKAYAMNAARYLPTTNPLTGVTDTLPSIAQGMGELDLAQMFDGVPRVLRDESTPRAIDTPLYTTNPVPQQTYFTRSGQSYEVTGKVFDPTRPFRVTLAWSDAPGDPASFKALVNDLDLEVTVAGKTYKGNAFRAQYSVDDPSFGADDLNTVESVFLPPGQTGMWSVVVKALNIAGDGVPSVGSELDQDFALVVYNGKAASDVPNPNTAINDSCQTARQVTQFPSVVTNVLVSGSCPTCYHKVFPNPTAGRSGVEAFMKIPLPAAGGLYTVNSAGSSTNMVLSVWKGTCGALVEVISTAVTAPISFVADGTNDFYVVAGGINGATGTNLVSFSIQRPAVTVVPTTIDFGAQEVGIVSSPKVVAVQNTGNSPVSLTAAKIVGLNQSDFSIVKDNCAGQTLLPGGSCGVTVNFRPSLLLASSAQLQIPATDPLSPHVVVLSGVGTVSEAILTTIPKAFVSFGDQIKGIDSGVNNVTVLNVGTAPMVITDVSISGLNAEDFLVVQDNCLGSTVPVGGSCTIGLRFNPSALGIRQATLTVSSTALGSPYTLPISGNGTEVTGALAFFPASLTFGDQMTGTVSGAKSVIVSNQAALAVTIVNVQVQGADFTETDNCNLSTLQTNGTCLVTVRFTPQAAGPRSTDIVLTPSLGEPGSIHASGKGVLPPQPTSAVCLGPPSLVYAATSPGTTSAYQSVTVTNCGNADLFLNEITKSGANASEFVLKPSSCLGGAIAKAATCKIDVAFAPTSAGVKVARLNVIDASLVTNVVTLSAGVQAKPDAQIAQVGSTSFLGDGVYSPTGVGESIALTVTNGATLKFWVKVRNDGNVADQFRLSGRDSAKGFNVSYFQGKFGSSDITGPVVAGTYLTNTNAPGAATDKNNWVRAEIQSLSGAASGSSQKVTVTAASEIDGSAKDTVKVVVTTECETNPVVAIGSVPFSSGGVDMRNAQNVVVSPTCGTGGRDIVFRLAPSLAISGRQFTVDTFGSNFATMLSVWKGTCGPQTQVTCNINAFPGSQQSQLSFTTDGASTYYIVGEGFKGVIGLLQVHVSSP